MKLHRSILTASIALATLLTTGHSEVFPILEDTMGSTTKNTIAKASGSAKTLSVSAKSTTYVSFGISESGIAPSSVASARLTVYLAKTSLTGSLSFVSLTSGFSETFGTPTIPVPTLGSVIETVNLGAQPLNREFYIVDVTDEVKAWLANPSSEHGIAIKSDGVASVILASKEGAGSGHPAMIEIDVNPSGGLVAGTSAAFSGNVAGDSFNGTTFVGSGASLTNLAAGNITTGTLADARLSANVALRNGANTFTGAQTAPAFVGSGASLTDLAAGSITTGTLADARLSSNVALRNSSNTFNGTVTAQTFAGNGTIPIGGIIMWSGTTPPTGWRICDGTNGTPDLRGRSIQGSGIGRAIGTTGGSEFKQLIVEELPPHSFSVSLPVKTLGYTASYNGSPEAASAPNNGTNNGNQTYTGSTNTIGNSQAFSIMNPYYVLAFIQRFQ
jgi:microcystin-dependent protein